MPDNLATEPAQDAADVVRGLYRGFLGREPDPDGLRYWCAQLAAGAGADSLLSALMSAPEYAQARAARTDLSALQARVAAAGAPLLARPLSIVDIGAQELEDEGHVYAPLATLPCRVVGFEPQEDKIAASRARNPDGRVELYPTFIGDGARHTFHINSEDATSSLLPFNDALTSQLAGLSHLRTVRTENVATSRLDDVLAGHGPVDFLKLDIQGFELPVLRAAPDVLKRTHVIHCEVAFAPIYAGQALFSEVDTLLRDAGFYLLDFSHLCRYPVHNGAGQSSRDRLGWGDAVFLREPELVAGAQGLLAQCLAVLLVYGKASAAAALAARFDAASGSRLAELFAQVPA
jgi:FkbM family methyltransferase